MASPSANNSRHSLPDINIYTTTCLSTCSQPLGQRWDAWDKGWEMQQGKKLRGELGQGYLGHENLGLEAMREGRGWSRGQG